MRQKWLSKVSTFFLFAFLFAACDASAQTNTSVEVEVLDPTGAIVTNATVSLIRDHHIVTRSSSKTGKYVFLDISPGHYEMHVSSPGFADVDDKGVPFIPGAAAHLNISLKIPTEHQQVDINGNAHGLTLQPGENATATIISGSELASLSDDPTEFQNELQALAGPGAGPNGGQLYIDGFRGGIMPPKSSIHEIRINNNPFSAEYDRIGYGRVEVLTKSSLRSLHGHLLVFGNDSGLNTANPLTSEQPSYYSYATQGGITGPLTHRTSYLLNGVAIQRQDQNIVDAIDQSSVTTFTTAAVTHNSTFQYVNPRLDFTARSGNKLTLEDSLYHGVITGLGVGALDLAQQAYSNSYWENALAAHSTWSLGSTLANEAQLRWLHVRNSEMSVNATPTVTVQGAFTAGGNNLGSVKDHQDVIEAHDYLTKSLSRSLIEIGGSGRLIKDTNYSTSASNGSYTFDSISSYLSDTPAQYQVADIRKPDAQALLYDGALFVQSDVLWRPNLDVSAGLRMEGQNRISNHVDWAPRFALRWSPKAKPTKNDSILLHAGYGLFYSRFVLPTTFDSVPGTPYIIKTIHDNGINQIPYVVRNPDFYYPGTVTPMSGLPANSNITPIINTISGRFHAALDMQGAVGIDWKIGKAYTFTATYLYTRGVHQYMSNNVTAPPFNTATYAVRGSLPTIYNYQFQSNGIYRQHQLIITTGIGMKRLSLHAVYTYEDTHADTQGVGYFPSVSSDPQLDYGRAGFAVPNQMVLLASYSAPYGIKVSPYLAAQSGTPFNVTTGSDLTANNQFNARPTFGTCGTPDVISTRYGCLDIMPAGKGERIIPYDLGTGPGNIIVNLRLSKTIPLFARGERDGVRSQPSGDDQGHRRYMLTLLGSATNLFNIVNLGSPNGVLTSPLFGRSQTLAGGQFSTATPGNRSISFQAMINF